MEPLEYEVELEEVVEHDVVLEIGPEGQLLNRTEEEDGE